MRGSDQVLGRGGSRVGDGEWGQVQPVTQGEERVGRGTEVAWV